MPPSASTLLPRRLHWRTGKTAFSGLRLESNQVGIGLHSDQWHNSQSWARLILPGASDHWAVKRKSYKGTRERWWMYLWYLWCTSGLNVRFRASITPMPWTDRRRNQIMSKELLPDRAVLNLDPLEHSLSQRSQGGDWR